MRLSCIGTQGFVGVGDHEEDSVPLCLTNLVRRCPLLPLATGLQGPHSMGQHQAQCRCEERSGPVLSHGPATTVVTVGLCLAGPPTH